MRFTVLPLVVTLALGCAPGADPESATAEDFSALTASPSGGQSVQDAAGRLYVSVPSQHVVLRADNALTAPLAVFAGTSYVPGYLDGPRRQARMNAPKGIAVDNTRNALYVADSANQMVRRVDLAANTVSTMLTASSAAAAGAVNGFGVAGVAVDGDGAVYVTDNRNYVVWRYNPSTGRLRVLAGTPGQRGCSDGVGAAARFNNPGIAVASPGLVSLTDTSCAGTPVVRLVETANGGTSTIGTAP